MTVAALLNRACDESRDVMAQVAMLGPNLQRACDLLAACWDGGGKLLTCGNGGSCADAMHLAEELTVRFCDNRRGLAAIALADVTAITCTGNDFGYERVFARQVEALGRPGDVLAVFSTSGNSANILAAVDQAKALGMKTIAFLGKDGGQLRGRCDAELLVPVAKTHRVQEGHELLYHTLCEWADVYAGC